VSKRDIADCLLICSLKEKPFKCEHYADNEANKCER